MFIENKYLSWYFAIIERRRSMKNPIGYSEKHHIIPVCLGGSNRSDNLIRLTVREHFLLHWLLTKFTDGETKRKMCFALHRMRLNIGQRNFVTWQIEVARNANAEAMYGNTIASSQKGKPKTEEHKQRMSLAALNRSPEYNRRLSVSLKGRVITEETRIKIGNANRGRSPSAETRQKLSEAGKGKQHSPETLLKMSIAAKRNWQIRKGAYI
jgi:NUMOD3 motif